LIKKFNDIIIWFFTHPVLIGICAFICAICALLALLLSDSDQHSSKSTEQSSLKIDCIKNPIQATSQDTMTNLVKTSSYLSGCYVDDCYTYMLKIINLTEADISNQYLKGFDWQTGVSVLDSKTGDSVYSTVIKTRSSGSSVDEAKTKNMVSLDSKIFVWMNSLNICNKEKGK
jgi:hypothetical protein